MATSSKSKNRATISEKISSYYGNVKSLLLGNDLTGRRQTCEENPFTSETQLTGFKRDQEEFHLKPTSVDLCRLRNREAHRTAEYEVPNLIIRRGQVFDINIDFNRNYIKEHDIISLKFVTGSRPTQSRGSVIPVSRVDKVQDGQWGFQMITAQEKSVTLRVSSGSDAIVGRYELFIDTEHLNDGVPDKWRHKHTDDIFVLFNPWQKDDAVYLTSEAERNEYVLTETGRIWLGSVEKYYVRPWNFGQVSLITYFDLRFVFDVSSVSESHDSEYV